VRTASCLILALLFALPTAHADEMDVTLARLRLQEDATTVPGTACPVGGGVWCRDDDAWTALISQLGTVLAPPVISPARTTGFRGFYLGIETTVTGIDEDSDYWARGTEGDSMSIDRNRFVDSSMAWTRLSFRKGLPFGIELGGSVGRLFSTGLWAWGAEAKISLFEGFREGLPGWIPDISVRGAVTTTTGDREFSLTTAGFDIVLSKPLVLARTVVLSPFLGPQLYWIAADSELVDLTPDRNAFDECMPETGPPELGDEGTVRCTGSSQDFANNQLFPSIRAFRARMVVGVQFQYDVFTVAGSIQWDLRAPSSTDDVPDILPRQWTVTTAAGVTY